MQTILIVDDLVENLYFLEALLKGNGFKVLSAANGAEALALVRQNPPDLIISDILMPVMDGYSLCKVLRDDHTLKHLPFIFYTATFVEKKDEELALSLGADRFLIKPLDPDNLMKVIQQVLVERDLRNMQSAGTEQELLRDYNEALFRKLEKKMADLERVNQELEQKIEEQKRLEEQLRQAQKMEAIGRFSAGIAHDLNNILTVIVGFGTIVQSKMMNDGAQREKMRHILAAAERAATLTRSLLTFSRKHEMELQPLNLKANIKNVETFLRRIIGQDINLTIKIPQENIPVFADGGQMEQVLMNLATNARDAMPNGGNFTITTDIINIDDDFIRAHGYGKPGRHVLVTVSDDGIGMDEATCQRIFEPFFTTKDPSRGTGLGLSIIYGIIKQHNGHIEVHSVPGQGTTFKILMPLMSEILTLAEVNADRPIPVGGNETILVVDDETPIRQFLETFLTTLGYKVLLAGDGQEAVDIFREKSSQIDLVLMDMIMPNKNAREAASEMRQTKGDVKILYISGYPYDLNEDGQLLEAGAQLIMKPVTPTDLAQKLRTCLDCP